MKALTICLIGVFLSGCVMSTAYADNRPTGTLIRKVDAYGHPIPGGDYILTKDGDLVPVTAYGQKDLTRKVLKGSSSQSREAEKVRREKEACKTRGG